MRVECDIVIIGLGAMGAAAAYSLGRPGLRIVALDRFEPGHRFGSSHGESRIIRQACFEHPCYAPLSIRSYELLDEFEQRRNERYSVLCGGLMMGLPDSTPVSGSLETADRWGLPYQLLEAKDLRRRFPMFQVPDRHVAFFEAKAGATFPEKLIRGWIEAARSNGVEVCTQRRVSSVAPRSGGVRVRGEDLVVDAEQAIVTAGPWIDQLIPEIGGFLSVERIVQHWFGPSEPEAFAPGPFPVFYWDLEAYQLYGFPSLDPDARLVKVGLDDDRSIARPDSVDREVTGGEIAALDNALRSDLPALHGSYVGSDPCLWTVTKDRNFLIGRHPAHDQIILAGGFSGRGFKFAPVVGEILAELAVTGSTRHDIALFNPERAMSDAIALRAS